LPGAILYHWLHIAIFPSKPQSLKQSLHVLVVVDWKLFSYRGNKSQISHPFDPSFASFYGAGGV
jgi:hypothetical protein